MCFFNVKLGNILRISLNIDFMENAPTGVRFTFATFSATSSNYSNEVRRNNGTQTPREITITSSIHGETAALKNTYLGGVFVLVKYVG